MTSDQKEYYEDEILSIRRGGYSHSAFVQDHISGMGCYNLGPLDPPVIGFAQDGDPSYTQYLQNWSDVETLISKLREEATKAWGEQP